MNFKITIEKRQTSKIAEFDPENIGFGKIFTDHMFLANWDGLEWKDARIVPYGPIPLSPATSAIHYGQSIFEGMKAFSHSHDKGIHLFRPLENWMRFNISAERMVMPYVPEELYIDGLKTLLKLESAWVPKNEKGSLYIRPLMFATDDFIGVTPSKTFIFVIFCCPVGPYYSKPLKIKVEETYSRSAPGGVGYVKCAGNYGGAMFPTLQAQKEGYDQVLWTDPLTHTLIEETGTSNLFAVIGGEVITPPLSATLLSGITRNSVIKGLRHLGYEVNERPLSIQALKNALNDGSLTELFITGTAATLVGIQGFGHRDAYFDVMDQGNNAVSTHIKTWLDNVRHGNIPDELDWNVKI